MGFLEQVAHLSVVAYLLRRGVSGSVGWVWGDCFVVVWVCGVVKLIVLKII